MLLVHLHPAAKPLEGQVKAVRPELYGARFPGQCGPVLRKDPVGLHQGLEKLAHPPGVVFASIVVFEPGPIVLAPQAQFGHLAQHAVAHIRRGRALSHAKGRHMLAAGGQHDLVCHQVHLEADRAATRERHRVCDQAVGLHLKADVPPLGVKLAVGAGHRRHHAAVELQCLAGRLKAG